MNLLKLNDTTKVIPIFMADSSTPTAGKTGLTVSVRLAKNGAAFGAAGQRCMALSVAVLVGEARNWIPELVAKAKSLRPVAEKCVTAARKGGVANHRNVVALIRDKDMAHKLFEEIGPRYAERPGGYTRILKLGTRQGDNAPMARIELV